MSVIDNYLKNVAPTQKVVLARIRAIVKQMIPDAQEVISYGVPAFKYGGRYIIFFAAFKNHMSLYPAPYANEQLSRKLQAFHTSKGTLQFTEANPIPEPLIKEIITYQLSKAPEK